LAASLGEIGVYQNRQEYIKSLVGKYKYDIDQIKVEVKVKMGSSFAKKKADIVVYNTTGKEQIPKVIVETKKTNRKDSLNVVKSFMNAMGAEYGVRTNEKPVFLFRENPYNFHDIRDIPANK